MPKPVLNNRINYNQDQIVNKLDTYINQSLITTSGPTFGNLHITGDTTIDGNLYIYGNTTVVDFTISSFENNILLLNNSEPGSGVTLVNAGLEIDRGSAENYRIIFNEATDTFRAGPVSSTKPVALREETPINNGIFIWDSTNSELVSTNDLPSDISVPNITTNSLQSIDIITDYATIGNIYVSGTLTSVNITNVNIINESTSTGTLIADNSTLGNIYSYFISSGVLSSEQVTSSNILTGNLTSENINITDTLNSNTILNSNLYSSSINISAGIINDLNVKNYPVFGFNSLSSRDVGIALQRYQISNDAGTGDVVTDTPHATFTLPSQITIDPNQCLFPSDASGIEDFYKGWWIKFGDQIRQITLYSSVQQIAVLDMNWTTQPTLNSVVTLYKNSYVVSRYNESGKTLSFGYTADLTSTYTSIFDNIDVVTNDIYANNINVGSMLDASITGSSLNVVGGCNIHKSLIVGEKFGLNIEPTEIFHLHSNTQANLLIQGTSERIILKNTNNQNAIIKLDSDNVFYVSRNGVNAFCVNTNGNIGIHTTNTNDSSINIASNSIICSDNNTGYLGINGGSTETINNGNAQIILYGKDHALHSSIKMYIGDNLNIYNTAGTSLVNVSNSGILTITNNTDSTLNAGAVIIYGGVNVQCTTNSQSVIQGGALTINGGSAIKKDLYIGGNVNVDGVLNVPSLLSQPTISFSDNVNCTILGYNNVNLVNIQTQNTLTFYVSITPSVTRDYCTFKFTLPSKSSNLLNRGDCIVSVSGWTDDINVIPLFNVIGVGVANTKDVFVKFSSVNTDVHYLQLNCVYSKS